MGLKIFEKIKFKTTNKILQVINGMVQLSPSFSSFGEEVMDDETVYTVVNRILDEYSKLSPRHIRKVDGKQVKVSDNNINAILDNPNSLMTKSDFIRRCAYLRLKNYTVFIYPTYDLYYNAKTGQKKKVYTGLYPLQPKKVEFREDDAGNYYVEFTFANGDKSGYLDVNDIIIWRKNYGENEFIGGKDFGYQDNKSILQTLSLNQKLWESTFKTVEGSLSIKGILKYGGLINKEDREKARLNFEEQLKNNTSGIIALDTGGDYISIPYNGKLVDSELLYLLRDSIRNHYGVSEEILNGSYTNEQKEAFYETAIEEGVISLGQAFSKVMLTSFERSNGNEIIFYTNRIQMMSADKKISLANTLLPIGGVTANEIRSWFGEQPIDGGDEPMMSLNWIKKSIAEEYQLDLYKNGNSTNNNSASNSEDLDNDEANDDIIKVGENNEQNKNRKRSAKRQRAKRRRV